VADINYLPGTSAMLVYTDEHGNNRSSFVEIVRKNGGNSATPWYIVIGNQEVFSKNHLVVPMERAKIDVKEGQGLALVREDQLKPVGTRTFSIVQ
jgi:hypothetical protein